MPRENLNWQDPQPDQWREVVRTSYHYHRSQKNPDGPPTLRVEYHQVAGARPKVIKEYLGIEHTGGFNARARKWWAERTGEPFPESVDHAANLGRYKALREPSSIQAHKDEDGFWRITGYVLGPQGEPLTDDLRDRARHPYCELETDNDCPF